MTHSRPNNKNLEHRTRSRSSILDRRNSITKISSVVEVIPPTAQTVYEPRKKSKGTKRKKYNETQTHSNSQPQSQQYSPAAKKAKTKARVQLSNNLDQYISPEQIQLLKHLGIPIPTRLDQNRSLSAPHVSPINLRQIQQYSQSSQDDEDSRLDSQLGNNYSADDYEDSRIAQSIPSLRITKSPPSSPDSSIFGSPRIGPMSVSSPSNASVSSISSSSSSQSFDFESGSYPHSPSLSSINSDYLNPNMLRVPYTSLFNSTKPPLFPSLPVLNRYHEYMKEQLGNEFPDFSNVVFACGQHLLETTGSLFEMLIAMRAKPGNIFVLGKSYSNCTDVIDRLKKLKIKVHDTTKRCSWGDFENAYARDAYDMWKDINRHIETKRRGRDAVESIIILDDGGHVLKEMAEQSRILCKYNIGIEQTTSGTNAAATRAFPVIQVCSSAIKNWCEPSMVAAVVAQKFRKIIEKYAATHDKAAEAVYGIVGFGHIGTALVNELLKDSIHKNIVIFDKLQSKREEARSTYARFSNVQIAEDIDTVFKDTSVIVGCTGTDITAGKAHAFDLATGDKILISCSSKDVEFHSLLLKLQVENPAPKDPKEDIEFQNKWKTHKIVIAKGGLPINFDNTPHSVAPNDIQLIRGLKLASIMQAAKMIKDWKSTGEMKIGNYQVDAKTQHWLYHAWLDTKRQLNLSQDYIKAASSLEKIVKASGGEPYVSPEDQKAEANFNLMTGLRM